MRATSLVVTALGLVVLTGCAQQADRKEGEAAPAAPASPTSTAGDPAPPASTKPSGGKTPGSTGGGIRNTDWRNATITSVEFLNLGDVTFRNGEARSDGRTCYILPAGAKPAYGHVVADEPANTPSGEDAIVLIECGGDATLQALIPVQLYRNKLSGTGAIEADRVSGPGPQMTFTSYHIDNDATIVTTVKQPDGKTETRRYRWGGNGWDRQ